jgi:hypothetical protein
VSPQVRVVVRAFSAHVAVGVVAQHFATLEVTVGLVPPSCATTLMAPGLRPPASVFTPRRPHTATLQGAMSINSVWYSVLLLFTGDGVVVGDCKAVNPPYRNDRLTLVGVIDCSRPLRSTSTYIPRLSAPHQSSALVCAWTWLAG